MSEEMEDLKKSLRFGEGRRFMDLSFRSSKTNIQKCPAGRVWFFWGGHTYSAYAYKNVHTRRLCAILTVGAIPRCPSHFQPPATIPVCVPS